LPFYFFKNKYPGTKVIAVQPTSDETILGIRRVETGMKWIDNVEIDKEVDMT